MTPSITKQASGLNAQALWLVPDIGAYERGVAISQRLAKNRLEAVFARKQMELLQYLFCYGDPVTHEDHFGLTTGSEAEACFCATCVLGLEVGCTFGCSGPDYAKCVHDCMYKSNGDLDWPQTPTGERCKAACTLATLPGPGMPFPHSPSLPRF